MLAMGATRVESPRLEAGLLRMVVGRMRLRPAVQRRLPGVVETIERDHLFHPVAIYRVFPVSVEEPCRLHVDGAVIEGDTGKLAGATEAAIVCISLGKNWSDAVATCFRNDELLRGFLLDEIGTTLLERLSRRVEAVVRLVAHQRGLQAGSPVRPGQTGWPLSVQARLAELAEARSAGIEVTSSGMLMPVKSLSMIIGIGHGLRRWSPRDACHECPAYERCEHRRSAEICA